jgi:hypothetical protein
MSVKAEIQAGRPKKTRASTTLSANLDKNLLAYAAAASAAGVSMLALAQPAEARIIYTKANVEIAPRKILGLDLNHDGISDFKFSNHVTHTSYVDNPFRDRLKLLPHKPNGVLSNAAVLASGVQVGSSGKFQNGTLTMVGFYQYCTHQSGSCHTSTGGAWKNITGGYLGLKFFIHGKAHFGWARLNIAVTNQGVYALLTGYAYETIANKVIVTGKTKGDENEISSAGKGGPATVRPQFGTLGQLAQGAVGLNSTRYQARRVRQ